MTGPATQTPDGDTHSRPPSSCSPATDAPPSSPATRRTTTGAGTGSETAHRRRHGVGLTDDQRARLTALIDSAPLPPPDVLTRLRGYLPPATPD
jgi:hypothetical protein